MTIYITGMMVLWWFLIDRLLYFGQQWLGGGYIILTSVVLPVVAIIPLFCFGVIIRNIVIKRDGKFIKELRLVGGMILALVLVILGSMVNK